MDEDRNEWRKPHAATNIHPAQGGHTRDVRHQHRMPTPERVPLLHRKQVDHAEERPANVDARLTLCE